MHSSPTTAAAPHKDGGTDLRDRSPHPYARKGSISRLDVQRPVFTSDGLLTTLHSDAIHNEEQAENGDTRPSTAVSGSASSESGTEADDEHDKGAHFLKALPPPTLRPRKGLKGLGHDGEVSPLLTPAQLDRDAKTISQGYFESEDGARRGKQEQESRDAVIARDLFEKRQRAERIRRVSEGALLGVIGVVVVGGHAVRGDLWSWHRELLSQVLTVAFVIALYPLRVVSRERLDMHLPAKGFSLLRRFRVPPSFDPASVLYPTFVPVLVALSLLPQYPALLLPNLILGLASLPPRLFPATSRLSLINSVGWLVAIVPLIASENTALPPTRHLSMPYNLKAEGPPFLLPEILVLLYPLHQTLLPPLNYLTTTSLLPAEKHMLATGLANLLCFATSPQACILRAMLWIGGVWALVTCTSVLHWNVILARVPKWRFSRVSARKRKLLDEIVLAGRELLVSRSRDQEDDSDTDDEPSGRPAQISRPPPPRLKTRSKLARADTMEPRSAVEAAPADTLDFISKFAGIGHRRRHTMPSNTVPTTPIVQQHASKKSKQRSARTWYLDLTLEGATLRRWLYACWVYAALASIILVPVRMAVSHHALQGREPISWALDYILGDLLALYNSSHTSHLTLSDSLTAYLADIHNHLSSSLSYHTFSIPTFRLLIGESNIRILLSAYWVLIVSLGILTVTILTPIIEVDTRRKIFHATIVSMLLPTTFIDPCFCGLALSIVLAAFLILEVIRAGQVPPLGAAIGRFVAPYVDGRDLRGPMVVSHVFLLIGCAIPLWLSLAGLERETGGRWPGWETRDDSREVAMVAGVVCVGMGDAAASLVGRRYGRRKWPWIGGKSLEGSAAFTVAVVLGLMAAKIWLRVGGWREQSVWREQNASHGTEEQTKRYQEFGQGIDGTYWAWQAFRALICGLGASFMEAVLTGANDNVVVPVALWLLVRGVGL